MSNETIQIAPFARQEDPLGRQIVSILEAHGLLKDAGRPEFWVRLVQEPWMPLVMETLRSPEGWRLSVAHYVEENGDLCPDPEVVMEIIPDGVLQVITFNLLLHLDAGPDSEFARVWAKNLAEQHWEEAEVVYPAEGHSVSGSHREQKKKGSKKRLPDDIPPVIEVDLGHFEGWSQAKALQVKGRWLHYQLDDGKKGKVQVIGRDILWRVPVAAQ